MEARVRQLWYIWKPAFNQVTLLSGLQLEPPSVPFISYLPGLPDLHVHAHQMPDTGSDSHWFCGPCPISASGLSLAPLPASLSVLSLATMPLHVEESVCSEAVNSACCNGCQISPTSTRGEPHHASRWGPEALSCPLPALHRDRPTNTPWASPGSCRPPNTLASRSPPKSASPGGESPGHEHGLRKQKVLGSASSPAIHQLSDWGQRGKITWAVLREWCLALPQVLFHALNSFYAFVSWAGLFRIIEVSPWVQILPQPSENSFLEHPRS